MYHNPAFAYVFGSATEPLIPLFLLIIEIPEVSCTAKKDKHPDNAKAHMPHQQGALSLQYFSASAHNPQIYPGAF